VTYSLDSTGTPSVTITPQAPGTAPQGPTGPQGPIGSTGASGATGPPGARRPSGPAGGIELVVCKPVLNNANNKRKPGQRVQDQAGQQTDQVHDHCLGPRLAFARRRRLRNRRGSDGAWAPTAAATGSPADLHRALHADPQATGGRRLHVHRADCSSACTPGGKCQTRPQSRPIRQSDCCSGLGNETQASHRR
jgi:hypothetical protein